MSPAKFYAIPCLVFTLNSQFGPEPHGLGIRNQLLHGGHGGDLFGRACEETRPVSPVGAEVSEKNQHCRKGGLLPCREKFSTQRGA